MTTSTHVHRDFEIKVPAEHADAVRAALAEWLAGKNHSTRVAKSPAEAGQVTLSFEQDDDGPAPDLSDQAMLNELQEVLRRSLSPDG